MQTALVCYIPVLHQGYFQFFKNYQGSCLYILGQDLIDEFTGLHREIRALDPDIAKKAIEGFGIFDQIEILTIEQQPSLNQFNRIVLPDEEISRRFAEKYLKDRTIKFISVFLRWDEKNVLSQKPVGFDRVSHDPFDCEMVARSMLISRESSCWWRHVGAIIVKDKRIIFEAKNQHVPSEHMPYINGDPRDFVEAGKLSHFASSLHAEQRIIAEAAKKGVSLSGVSIYLTVFPCPACSKLIAYSGISHCYFAGGHASLDGQEILKINNVEIIYVPQKNPVC